MKRVLLIVIVPLVLLGLTTLAVAHEPAAPPPDTDEATELTDDAYCKNWCCRRVCNEKNECYQYCWCCG
jgi:hypothetical protein